MLRRLASSAALVTAAVLLAGCTPPDPVETTPPPVTTAPTPSATPRSDALAVEEAFHYATDLNRLVDQAFREGQLPSSELEPIASPELIGLLQADLDAFTSRGLRLEGDSVLDTPTLISHDPSSASSGTVVLAVCMDTSGTTTFDSTGQVVSGGVVRQPRLFELAYDLESMVVTRTGPPENPLDLAGCPS